MGRMKLGGIAVAMCLLVSVAHATPSLSNRVERHRQAYERDSNPAHLVRIAHEYRLAGDAKQALAYFCSYIYVDAAGELAEEASRNARALSGQLGYPTDSDHEACKPRKASAPVVKTGIELTEAIPQAPPRITKREVAGLVMLGGTLTSLGLSLYEARKITEDRRTIAASKPGTDIDAVQDRKESAELRQKLWLAAGGATLITGGLLYITGRADRKRAERAYVAPSLSKGGGGLVFGGRF